MSNIETQIHEMIVERITPVAEILVDLQTKVADLVANPIVAAAHNITVECVNWKGEKSQLENQHPATETMIAKLQHEDYRDRNIYVYGPAGTGKTTAGINIAKLLNLSLYIQGTAMSKYDLLGFRLPCGEVVRTAFMDAWEYGGMIILDDCDRSDPKAMCALNAATANGSCDFSHCGLGLIKRHQDCIIFATGNTAMNGQDAKYSAASKQDAAFRDRFTFHHLELDEAFETSLGKNPDWTKRVQKIRATCGELKGNVDKLVMASMRATIQGASLLQAGLSQAEVEESIIFKGAGNDISAMVYAQVAKPSTVKGKVINFE